MLKQIFLAFLSFSLIFCLGFPALADTDFDITSYSMYIDVLSDGSADVTETLIYQFDGEYNGILSLFDTDGIDGVENFSVSIDGEEMTPVAEMEYIDNTYTTTTDGSLTEVRIYSPGSGDTRVVVYEYTMLGLADRYEDTGMILRSFIGGNSQVSLQNAVVAVHFQEEADIRAFVHGAMDENHIEQAKDTIVFGPETIHSGDTVEVRLLFPTVLIEDAPLQEGMMLEQALAEEQSLIEEAERQALLLRNAKYLFTAVYVVAFFLIWLLMARKYGLKGRLHEAPDPRRLLAYPAAYATAAVEEEADTDALSGTMMELVQAGVLRMESQDGDVRFTLANASPSGLHPHQAQLLSWLFDGRDTLLLSELNAGSDYELAQAFEKGYQAYCAQVSSEMLTRNLRFRNDGLRILINSLIVILGCMGAGGILIAGEPDILLGLIVGGMLFFLLYLMSRVRRLTDEGERLQADANALRAAGVVQDGSLFDFLPYYTALGMTEPLVEAVETQENSGDIPGYIYAGWHLGLHRLPGSMRDTHHHNASIPNPNASSSSGGGGGGSNGGGGGHGAW